MSKYLVEFVALATAHFLALISPGPDFFLVVGTSVREGASRAAGLCAGIAAANGAYILLALTGFAFIKEPPLLFTAIRTAGALYLLYLGLMLLKPSQRPVDSPLPDDERPRGTSRRSQFAAGFLSAILNPKNAVFYLSLFTVIVSRDTPQAIQACYGLWMVLAVFFWDLLIARLAGSEKVRARLDRHTHWIEKCSGGALLLLGAVLLLR
ncbi:LysE family translocator [Geomonas oryzisoli]|uniref:LysE family translocator n=1 Tax=Geomonas oryzisoli TaxID=2847992 RepID=A0ABX8JAQ2_9BACT|nr:LysE family translocator [Geomonas oryzisoli]QWV94679.1 LysE family translocator [Geomonas oryzisoli]